MKKSTAFLLLFLCCFGCFGFGCGGDPKTTTATTEAPRIETPVSEFEYEVKEDGVTIKKYLGTKETVVVPATVEGKPVVTIGWCAFYENATIKEVDLPQSVKSIDAHAFELCHALEAINLDSDQLKSIAKQAFLSCENLKEVSFGIHLEQIDWEAFRDCTSLNVLQWSKQLNYLGTNAFWGCTGLKSAEIPNTLTHFGEAAFAYSGLETLSLQEGLTEIGASAFGATKLKQVTIPASVKMLEYGTFALCEELETVILSEGLEKISTEAFLRCTKLKEIVIPKTVTSASHMAFNKCSALEKVCFEGNAPQGWVLDESIYPFQPENVHYTIYYHAGATGFTSPEWCGYPTAIW